MTFRRWMGLGLAASLMCAACAHSKSGGVGQESGKQANASKPTATTRFANEEIGVSIELPSGLQFVPGETLGTLARAPDSSEFRVFIEHLSKDTDERGCWDRLYHRVPAALLDSPRDVDELMALAKAGIRRGDRFVYLAVYPQGSRCFVLVGEGPKDSKALTDAVPVARKTFAVGTPSKAMATEFDIDAGMQLLEAKDYAGALASFERALAASPQSPRAEFGAGLAAYFAGPEYAAKAIQHLSAVSAIGVNEEMPSQLRPEQLRDALMYLGLAYAAKKDYPHATATLAEVVARSPNDATGRYNLACVLALSGDSDAAMTELRESLHQEPSLVAHAQEDEDLKSLRDLPSWKELFKKTDAPSSKRTPR